MSGIFELEYIQLNNKFKFKIPYVDRMGVHIFYGRPLKNKYQSFLIPVNEDDIVYDSMSFYAKSHCRDLSWLKAECPLYLLFFDSKNMFVRMDYITEFRESKITSIRNLFNRPISFTHVFGIKRDQFQKLFNGDMLGFINSVRGFYYGLSYPFSAGVKKFLEVFQSAVNNAGAQTKLDYMLGYLFNPKRYKSHANLIAPAMSGFIPLQNAADAAQPNPDAKFCGTSQLKKPIDDNLIIDGVQVKLVHTPDEPQPDIIDQKILENILLFDWDKI